MKKQVGIRQVLPFVLETIKDDYTPDYDVTMNSEINAFLDSLEIQELCLSCEKHYNICILDKELKDVQYVRDLVTLIIERHNADI